MALLMRDSIDPTVIPLTGLNVVAGYGDGRYVWSSTGWARFQPPIVSLSIVTSAVNVGDILDVEMGDATPADCPGWADRFSRPGRRLPTIYCDRLTIRAVRTAMGNRPFDWWAATLDGTQSVSGAVAVQYAGSDRTGGNYDESIIWDESWIGESDMPLPDGLRFGLAHMAIKSVYQREPLNVDELAAVANSINSDGSNLGDVVQNLAANLSQPDEVRLQNETLAAAIDQLKNAGSVAAHTHTVPGGPTSPPVTS